MTIKTVWICDGCGTEKMMVMGMKTDWKTVEVHLAGLEGYPTNAKGPSRDTYQLCPDCAKRLYDYARPKLWPQVMPRDASLPAHDEE